MQVLYIHNPHDSSSRELRSKLTRELPEIIEVDFMQVRDKLWFRGAPAVYLFADDQDLMADSPAWKAEVEVDSMTVLDVIPKCRVIETSQDRESILANGEDTCSISFSLKDLDLVSVPFEPLTLNVGGEEMELADGLLDFSSLSPGVFEIEARHPYAAPVRIEVVAL